MAIDVGSAMANKPSIPQAFRNAVATHCDQPLLLSPDASLTFGEVDAASSGVAGELMGSPIAATEATVFLGIPSM